MAAQLKLGDTTVHVILKDIKNVHLSVYPPTGRVRISAPSRMDLNTIRAFAISKLGWIRRQQKQIGAQEREWPRAYVERETHYVWGRRYLMQVREGARSGVELKHDAIILCQRKGACMTRRHEIMQDWYRQQLKDAIPELQRKWAARMGVSPTSIGVRRMKTMWGSCSPDRGAIRINLELVKKPRECLEYILVHELAHLLEHTHNNRFIAHMDRLLPDWRHRRDELNRLPVPHEDWIY